MSQTQCKQTHIYQNGNKENSRACKVEENCSGRITTDDDHLTDLEFKWNNTLGESD